MPRPKEFSVTLSAGDPAKLTKVVSSGRPPARMITRARVLLALDETQGRRPLAAWAGRTRAWKLATAHAPKPGASSASPLIVDLDATLAGFALRRGTGGHDL